MRFKTLINTTFLMLTYSLLVASPANGTSPCPPVGAPVIALDRPNWIIAEVTILESLASVEPSGQRGARARVERLYHGILNEEIVLIANSEDFLDCGTIVSNLPIGSRWVVGMGSAGSAESAGTFGGRGNLSLARLEADTITGKFFDVTSPSRSASSDEFAELVTETYTIEGPGTLELLGIATDPEVVTEGEDFELVLSGFNLFQPTGMEIDLEDNVIRSSAFAAICFSAGNPPYPPNNNPAIVRVPIAGLPAGNYRVEADQGPDCFNDTSSIAQDIYVFPSDRELTYVHESPRAGETVSGVGLIRGWACNPDSNVPIRSATFTIDDLDIQFPLPYGSLRQDTGSICKSDFDPFSDPIASGYGGVFFWGIFDDGAHTFTLYIDGEEVESFEFYVAQPPFNDATDDQGFRKGASGEYIIDNFLGTDETVTIRWSESDQNFIIVEYD